MMPLRSIRFRLALWYWLTMALILGMFAAGARLSMRASLLETIDHDLRGRLPEIRKFLEQHSDRGTSAWVDMIREETELGMGGGLVEVWDGAGHLLFRTPRLAGVALGKSETRNRVNFGFGWIHRSPLRVASQAVSAGGRQFTVAVAEPLDEMEESLQRFDRALFISLPLLLLLASVGGWWMSTRAMAPVDRIALEAARISIGNLSARVPVPTTEDELHRLAQTLNEMLGRIEIAVRRMTQFTADASHELRAPLTLIHTAADFSLRGERPREDLVEAMRKIARESMRTGSLIDNLLVLARADSGVDPIELREVDLVQIAQKAQDEMRPAAQAKQIELTLKTPEEPLHAKGDEDSLTRLIVILLDNAVKYTNPGGRVGIAVRLDGCDAEVVVTDTGIGIASEDLPRIWDRFWRADKVRSRSMGGAGLGLSIAREIATRQGAVVDAESAMGRGSRFSVRLRAAGTTSP